MWFKHPWSVLDTPVSWTTTIIFVLLTIPILPLPSGFRLCPTTSWWHYWGSTYAKNLSKVEAETNGWAGGSCCSWGLSKPEAKWWIRAEQDAWGSISEVIFCDAPSLHVHTSHLPQELPGASRLQKASFRTHQAHRPRWPYIILILRLKCDLGPSQPHGGDISLLHHSPHGGGHLSLQ